MFRPKTGSQTDRSVEIFNYINENGGVHTGELVRTFGHEFNQQMNFRNRFWKRMKGSAHIKCRRSPEYKNQRFYYVVPATGEENDNE